MFLAVHMCAWLYVYVCKAYVCICLMHVCINGISYFVLNNLLCTFICYFIILILSHNPAKLLSNK